MRLLVIAARADLSVAASEKHVEIEWPDASLVEHRLGEDNPLEAQFAAVGFDAVIIVGAPTGSKTCPKSGSIRRSIRNNRAQLETFTSKGQIPTPLLSICSTNTTSSPRPSFTKNFRGSGKPLRAISSICSQNVESLSVV